MHSVSAVIPTLNSEKYLDECLSSLRSQDYGGALEIVLVDAGSTDRTVAVAREHAVDQLLDNPLRTGEAGKAVGFRAAQGELILTLDSDNVLVGSDWLARMVAPFSDPEIMAAQPLRWDYRRQDHFVTRWAALTGVGDPLALYIGNYDHYSHLTGRWTDYPHRAEHREGWLRVEIDPRWVPTIGANGYLVRRDALEQVPFGEYFFDIDFVSRPCAARARHDRGRRRSHPPLLQRQRVAVLPQDEATRRRLLFLLERRAAKLPLDKPQEEGSRSLRGVDAARRPASRGHRQGLPPETRPGLALPPARMLDHAGRLRDGSPSEDV